MQKKSRIFAFNYANEAYAKAQWLNSFTVRHIGGVDDVRSFSPADIPANYREANKAIFSYKRGDGLWLWKPYLALKALRDLNDGDVLFYSDSGSFCIGPIRRLVKSMDAANEDMMFFELPLIARCFTKAEASFISSVDLGDRRQVAAGYFLIRKTLATVAFLEKWLQMCEDERLISPQTFLPDVVNSPDFIAHREDQSVLTILCEKDRVQTFRDPSDYGRFPWQYVVPRFAYSEGSYLNSDYPVVILSNRSRSAVKYFFAYVAKCLILKLGFGGFLKRRYVKS